MIGLATILQSDVKKNFGLRPGQIILYYKIFRQYNVMY